SAYGSAGERCMAISAAVAVGESAPLMDRLREMALATKVGPGRDPASEMGPVVTRAAKERIEGLIASGAAQGATLTVDGRGIAVRMAYYSFGGWKDSLFGQHHIHGPEGVNFYTRGKVVTARWPHVDHPVGASFHFPTAS